MPSANQAQLPLLSGGRVGLNKQIDQDSCGPGMWVSSDQIYSKPSQKFMPAIQSKTLYEITL